MQKYELRYCNHNLFFYNPPTFTAVNALAKEGLVNLHAGTKSDWYFDFLEVECVPIDSAEARCQLLADAPPTRSARRAVGRPLTSKGLIDRSAALSRADAKELFVAPTGTSEAQRKMLALEPEGPVADHAKRHTLLSSASATPLARPRWLVD